MNGNGEKKRTSQCSPDVLVGGEIESGGGGLGAAGFAVGFFFARLRECFFIEAR